MFLKINFETTNLLQKANLNENLVKKTNLNEKKREKKKEIYKLKKS